MKKILITALVCTVAIQYILFHAGIVLGQETAYTVQLMYCRERENALEYAENLKNRGFEASVTEAPDSTGRLAFKVFSGSFTERNAAARYALSLKAQGIDCWVTAALTPAPSAQKPRPALSDNVTQPRPAEPPAASRPAPVVPDNATGGKISWPAVTTRTYKYFDPEDGTLHVTNALGNIPAQFRTRIREIAIYPVKYLSLNTRDMVLLALIDREQKKVRIAEVAPPDRQVPADCLKSFEAFLRGEPLRIKYDPGRTGPDGTLQASLYLHTGISLGLEMVRQGIAPHNPDGISALELKEFTEMENRARQEKACIWASP